MENGADPSSSSSSREDPASGEQQISRDGEPGAAREQQSSSEYLQQQNDSSREEDEASTTQLLYSEADDQRQEAFRGLHPHTQKDQSSESSWEEEQLSSEAASPDGSTSVVTIEAEHVVDSSTRKSVKFEGTSDSGPNTSDPQPSDLEPSTSSAPGITRPRSSLKRSQSSKKASLKTHFADQKQQPDGVTADYNNETFISEGEEEDEEEFDPYYGIGANKDPIVQYPVEMVFGLINAKRFRPMSEANCPGRIKWSHRAGVALGVTVAAVLCFYFGLFIHQLATRPQLPRFEVIDMDLEHGELFPVNESIVVQQQQAGKGNYFAYRLNLFVYYILNITNINPRVDFHIEYVELSVVYGGTNLGYDRVENMELPRSSTRSPVLLVFVLGLPVSLRVGYTLLPQLRVRDFTVVAEFSAKLKMFILPGLKSIAFRTRYRCELHTASYSLHQKCVYLSGDKGVPSHKHLRFWRTPEWPHDLNTLRQTGVPLPLEYGDPAYNYNMRPASITDLMTRTMTTQGR